MKRFPAVAPPAIREGRPWLSIGGGAGGYTLNSEQDAADLAQYIWNSFLGGSSSKRPLGDAVLDGVDFDIEGGNPDYYRRARGAPQVLRRQGGQQGGVPVGGAAVPVPGPVGEHGQPDGLMEAVDVRGPRRVHLPRITRGAGSGGERVHTGGEHGVQVLPALKGSGKYGGVMLWSKFYDDHVGYSSAIKNAV
ncbi:Acidic endochitinase [Hordeum vulgare]|nr:Acidic endochitinase [Hordeum vulgare]